MIFNPFMYFSKNLEFNVKILALALNLVKPKSWKFILTQTLFIFSDGENNGHFDSFYHNLESFDIVIN